MKYFILYIINWLIVMIITFLLYSFNHLDYISFIGGIIATIIIYLNCRWLNK